MLITALFNFVIFKLHGKGNSVLAVDIIPPLPPNPGEGICWTTVYRCVNKGLQNLSKQCARHLRIEITILRSYGVMKT